MSVVSVKARDFILALFIRDDGQRFLLGDNGYDFKDSQLHFSANTIENDEVVKQGADGVMLAGQVRRASVQSFDGYIGDATMPKETIEQMRRDFFAFFAKGHHFRVVYVDTARNAWQRKGGYLVDAPEVKELYQIHPEYHVGLNFEDVSYYSYNENSDGDEILANTLAVPVSTDVNGGLEWDENGAVSEPAVIEYDTETAEASGKSISISDAADAPLASFQLDGETSQNGTPTPSAPVPVQTVTGDNVVRIIGKNLFNLNGTPFTYRTSVSVSGDTLTAACTTAGVSYVSYWIPNSDELRGKTCTISVGNMASNTAGRGGRILVCDAYASNPANTYATIAQLTESDTSVTFTFPANYSGGRDCFSISFYTSDAGASTQTGESVSYTDVQLEYGSTTEYEAYKEQDFEIDLRLSKNWLDISSFALGGMANGNPDPNAKYRINNAANPIAVKPNTKYTISAQLVSPVQGYRVGIHECGITGGFIRDLGWNQLGSHACTFTTGATTYYIKIVGSLSTTSTNVTTGGSENTTACSSVAEFMRGCTLQFEAGSSATPYVAYDALELCKIGTYQDYIYKSGGKWYVRKEIGKVTVNGSELIGGIGWTKLPNVSPNTYYLDNYIQANRTDSTSPYFCDYFKPISVDQRYIDLSFFLNISSRIVITYDAMSSVGDFKTWLGIHSPSIYYVLKTPTDTEITNEALIAQLDALLDNARTYAGVNNIFTVTPNEQGTLEIGYYTKYDLKITAGGYVWEVGGEGGPTTVLNNSIDNVAPIWTVKGPTLNPTLENATTGEQIEYVGMIAEGQTLVIDMGEQTALLDGLNVISNVVGDYISLAPGANTLLYSVTGSADASEIGWSEIVG